MHIAADLLEDKVIHDIFAVQLDKGLEEDQRNDAQLQRTTDNRQLD